MPEPYVWSPSTFTRLEVVPVCGWPAPRWQQWVARQRWLPWALRWKFGAVRCGQPGTHVGWFTGRFYCAHHASEAKEVTRSR